MAGSVDDVTANYIAKRCRFLVEVAAILGAADAEFMAKFKTRDLCLPDTESS